jgi:hypothetical protein
MTRISTDKKNKNEIFIFGLIRARPAEMSWIYQWALVY